MVMKTNFYTIVFVLLVNLLYSQNIELQKKKPLHLAIGQTILNGRFTLHLVGQPQRNSTKNDLEVIPFQ